MNRTAPHTLFESLGSRRFLVSSWPWRSLGYLFSTAAVACVVALPIVILGLPWEVLIGRAIHQIQGGPAQELSAALIAGLVVSSVLLVLYIPLAARPLAMIERRRLSFVDTRPLGPSPGDRANTGQRSWLLRRFTDVGAWREVAYLAWLVTLGLGLSAIAAGLIIVSFILLLSPALVGEHVTPIALGLNQITSVSQALPYMFVGLFMVLAMPHTWTFFAGLQAAAARALLKGDEDRLAAELVEVSKSRARLVDAFEAERKRIERDLHDGAQERLVSLTLRLGMARLDTPPDSPAYEEVAYAHDQAKLLMADLRELVQGIHPQVLVDRGLPAALHELADRSTTPITVHADFTERLPSHVEAIAYFVVAEALTNIAKHSAASAATITARHTDNLLTIEVSDNGNGGADPERGTGLTGLADRIAVVDGKMYLSSPQGGPTLLRVELPCPQSA